MSVSENLNQEGWNFRNSYQQLPTEFFESTKPKEALNPDLLILNKDLASLLHLDFSKCSSTYLANLFAGNTIPSQASPIALAYAGHQFGHFTRLGDGRAILLGEHLTPNGQAFDIQFKGSGRTPFSRNGDGLATLEAMLKEYLFGEALTGLGIPSTRSLALVKTGELVYREKPSHRAIITRVANSHIRVGTFEYAARLGPNYLKALADYAIERHYPHCMKTDSPYLALLEEVIQAQALLVAKWMSIGFIHGVLNTDNVLISGESIDFGPCAFMDAFSTSTVFSSIDVHGRYAYGEQASITLWNLCRFAECLIPLIEIKHPENGIEKAQEALEKFQDCYQANWAMEFCKKIGFDKVTPESTKLAIDLLNQMQDLKLDFTWAFRQLAHGKLPNYALENWKNEWRTVLSNEGISFDLAQQLMLQTNPAIIPRNHEIDRIIKDAAVSCKMDEYRELIEVLKSPFSKDFDSHPLAKPSDSDLPHFVTYCGT